MHVLLKDEPGRKVFLLGNEAIVRGALEAGVEVATAYPGTPSSEIPDTFYALSKESDVYFEYSTNEKVALEVASAAAIAGMRSICSMKHVGLNVAADPLNTLSYTGVKAGMVIVTADDPAMHSSQNEQDNRFYAKLSLIPMLEPSDPEEAGRLTRLAFDLSEELEMPILLRTTTRVNHTRGVYPYGDLRPRRFQGHFDKNPMRWVPVPGVARQLRLVLLERQKTAYEAMQRLGLDRIEGEGDLGIITSGVSYSYVKELLEEFDSSDRVRVLKITSIHPLPEKQIGEVLTSCRRVMVVEELEPYLETDVRAMAQRLGSKAEIIGKAPGDIPRHYELSGDRLRPVFAKFLEKDPAVKEHPKAPELPPRPPMLCAGCTHRTTYYAVKSIAGPDTYFPSDIGCYTLGLRPPLSTTDSFLCMGSSVTMASGASIRNPQKHVAFIGDSTFFHSGLSGLINAVHNRHDLLLIILDNSTTAMTGHQPHAGAAVTDDRHETLKIEDVVRSVGVKDVHVVDPEDLKATISTIQSAYNRKGVRVIVSKHPCPLFARRVLKEKQDLVYRVNHDACKLCGKTGTHEPCGIPILPDDEILRARTKILSVKSAPGAFPAPLPQSKPASAPCTLECPSNICVFGYMSLVRAGRYDEALAMIREQVPLPAALGRVCHHPCESECIRGDYEGPVAINAVKRFLTEREDPEKRREHYLAVARKGKERLAGQTPAKVAVIGAGPAGLTAAHDLVARGYAPTIFEKETVPGGLLATGIPPYRMPRDVLKKEIEAVLGMGIELRTGQRLGRDYTVESLLSDGFDAVCVCIGAGKGMRLAVEGEDASGVEDGVTFLRRVNLEEDRTAGKRVVVVGGGDAAVDAARTAVRLGASQVTLAYRRSREEMPAAFEEIESALEEGVRLETQVQPVGIQSKDGEVVGLRVVRTALGEPDAGGRRRPVPVEGSDFLMETDHIIAAIGQGLDEDALAGDVALERFEAGGFRVDRLTGATSHDRVFFAGDCTGEGWTVITAIAQGKKAAYGVDRALRGEKAEPLQLRETSELKDEHRYHPEAAPKSARAKMPRIETALRISGFTEVETGIDEETAHSEALRCLSCGQCARCNNCIDNFGCPAIYKKDGRVYIDEVLCVGCGVCAQLCPNDAIVPVTRDGAAV